MRGFSLIKLFSSFAMLGAEWVLWLLVALSFVSVAVIFERWRYFRRLREDLNALGTELHSLLKNSEEPRARERLQRSAAPASLVALAGLDELSNGAEASERVMASELARVRPALERNLAFLGTVGNNAPFIGLFGTVLGIIQSFDALKPAPGLRGAAAAAAATAATGRVMGTIAEALVATAVGLLVAIPAVVAFNYFQRVVKAQLASSEVLSQLVLAHAHRTAHEAHASLSRSSERPIAEVA